MDIALAVENILPAAEYRGSVTANSKEAWDAVIWQDTRLPKPAWAELEAAAPDPLDEARAARRAEIIARFAEIDADSVRPLRALVQGEATEADKGKLAALDAEAEALRGKLVELGG